MPTLQTKSAQPAAVTNKWIVVDAEGAVVGRLASFIAMRLRGKHRADFTPHVDTGDFVVVVNAEKVAFTGKKLLKKVYHWHTGYPGGIKQRTAAQVLDGAHPERVIEKAVERMLPKGALGRQQIRKLHVYPGPEHPHAGQAPTTLDLAANNRKNIVKESADG